MAGDVGVSLLHSSPSSPCTDLLASHDSDVDMPSDGGMSPSECDVGGVATEDIDLLSDGGMSPSEGDDGSVAAEDIDLLSDGTAGSAERRPLVNESRAPPESLNFLLELRQLPDRLPPFVLEGPHEVFFAPQLDVDWTLCPDCEKEQARRQERNELIKLNLLAGKNACYRSSGWSLWPRVWSNDRAGALAAAAGAAPV